MHTDTGATTLALPGCHPAQPTPAFSSCPQLRLSPTLLSTYDLYDNMIFMFMTHARVYHHPLHHNSMPCLPRSPLGGGRLSSIWSSSLLLVLCLWPWRHSQKNKTSFEDISVLLFAGLTVTGTVALCLWPTTPTSAYSALLMI